MLASGHVNGAKHFLKAIRFGFDSIDFNSPSREIQVCQNNTPARSGLHIDADAIGFVISYLC
jgi:hypothetical protein